MNIDKNTPRFLGAAFLLQAVASLVSGLFLAPGDLLDTSVSDHIAETMIDIADHATRMRASIVGEMITAIGIALLGSLLFTILRKRNEQIVRVALGLYLIEAGLLAVREILIFALLTVSQESVAAGHPVHLQSMGKILYESQNFGYSLHTLVFACGATMFYYVFFRSGYLPRLLALWGLIAAHWRLSESCLSCLIMRFRWWYSCPISPLS